MHDCRRNSSHIIGKEKGCEQIEVFSYNESEDDTSIVHGKVDEITTQNKKGYSIRVIRNGKLGFAYSSHISDPRQLIDNALASLQGNINATFDFPHTAKIEKTNLSFARYCNAPYLFSSGLF